MTIFKKKDEVVNSARSQLFLFEPKKGLLYPVDKKVHGLKVLLRDCSVVLLAAFLQR